MKARVRKRNQRHRVISIGQKKLHYHTTNTCDRSEKDITMFMAEYGKYVYEEEVRREESIIQQASHVQTAFSFVIAALFMLASIAVDNRGVLSYNYLLLAFSTISLFLVLSLILATYAQKRVKRKLFPTVQDVMKQIEDQSDEFQTGEQRNRYMSAIYEEIQNDYYQQNDRKVHVLIWSMYLFFIALGLCFIWFLISLIILF